jgi:hypothetical protein
MSDIVAKTLLNNILMEQMYPGYDYKKDKELDRIEMNRKSMIQGLINNIVMREMGIDIEERKYFNELEEIEKKRREKIQELLNDILFRRRV